MEVLAGFGGFWIDPETQAVGLDRPEAIAAAQFLVNTLETGISPEAVLQSHELSTLEGFLQGDSAFLRNWPNAWSEINHPDSPIHGKVGAIPMQLRSEQADVAKSQGRTASGSWGLGINRQSQHRKQALIALNYFTSLPAQYHFMKETSYLPAYRLLYQKAFPGETGFASLSNAIDPHQFSETEAKALLLRAIEEAVQRPALPPANAQAPSYITVSQILQKHLSFALASPRSSAKTTQAMQAAALETRQALEAD